MDGSQPDRHHKGARISVGHGVLTHNLVKISAWPADRTRGRPAPDSTYTPTAAGPTNQTAADYFRPKQLGAPRDGRGGIRQDRI